MWEEELVLQQANISIISSLVEECQETSISQSYFHYLSSRKTNNFFKLIPWQFNLGRLVWWPAAGAGVKLCRAERNDNHCFKSRTASGVTWMNTDLFNSRATLRACVSMCEHHAERDSFKEIESFHLINFSCFMVFSSLSQSVLRSLVFTFILILNLK